MKAMNFGYVHLYANRFDSSVIHKGLDVIVNPNSGNKTEMELELFDYDIINGNSSTSGSDFPRQRIEELFNTVLSTYYDSTKVVEAHQAAEKVLDNNEPMIVEINGKIIKQRITVNGEDSFRLHAEGEPAPELVDMINDMAQLKSLVALELKQQILFCKNKLRVGTLDMPKGINRLHVHTTEGYALAPDRVTRKQVIATLWFITSRYLYSPSFRKHLTLEITRNGYTAGVDKGVAYFKTEGLSELEKQIIADLELVNKQ
jgi:hypothetical protein